jgi:hypothetical protein
MLCSTEDCTEVDEMVKPLVGILYKKLSRVCHCTFSDHFNVLATFVLNVFYLLSIYI